MTIAEAKSNLTWKRRKEGTSWLVGWLVFDCFFCRKKLKPFSLVFLGWIRILSDACARANLIWILYVWTGKFLSPKQKVAHSKMSGYMLTGPFVNVYFSCYVYFNWTLIYALNITGYHVLLLFPYEYVWLRFNFCHTRGQICGTSPWSKSPGFIFCHKSAVGTGTKNFVHSACPANSNWSDLLVWTVRVNFSCEQFLERVKFECGDFLS